MKAGDAFYTPNSADGGRHLWLIVSDPAKTSIIVIANFSTDPHRSPTRTPADCGVKAGSHPKLKVESYVRCDRVRTWDLSTEKLQFDKFYAECTVTTPAPPSLLLQVQTVLVACDRTKGRALEAVRTSLPTP